MPIDAPSPVIVPEQVLPSKTFLHVWILDLNIRSHPSGELASLADSQVYLNFCPTNANTGEILVTAQREYRFPLLKHLVKNGGQNPLAAALAAVEAAAAWIEAEELAESNPPPP